MSDKKLIHKSLEELSIECEDLLHELDKDEHRLLELTEEYDEKSFKIVHGGEVDFKELYGKNNESIRKHHVKEVLSDLISEKQDLEQEINHKKRVFSIVKLMMYGKMEHEII